MLHGRFGLAKLPIKHPNQRRLEEAIEKRKLKKKPIGKKKEINIPSSHRKVKKEV
jgi:hypothetical protein